MQTVRWIGFLPAAFVGSVLGGVVGTIGANALALPEFWRWSVSGGFSAGAFFFVGFKIAPAVTTAAKWSLVLALGVLGTMSFLGGFLENAQLGSFAAGGVMVIASIGVARLSNEEIEALLYD